MYARKVLISGASIAGPAAALWLTRLGYEVTVIELAPSLRAGGQAVDFKGRTHRTVLQRMGIWADVLSAQTPKTDLRIVDDTDQVQTVMPGEFLGGDVEILRGDLTRILHAHTEHDCEYVFGDRITQLSDTANGVEVSFARRPPETFDLVLGADGMHSGVRRLAFGPEEQFVKPLGYFYAVANASVPSDLEMSLPSGRQVGYAYNEPGRLAVLGGSKAPQLFVFAGGQADYDRHDLDSQKRFLARHYRDAGWRVPELLAAVLDSSDFYLDSLSRTRMSQFTAGRVALLGDAGYANTLGGFGTGLALVGAYVLAGELRAAGGDHQTAFAGYDRRMRKPTNIARSGNAGPFLAPPSRTRIRLRNFTFSNRIAYAAMRAITDTFATDDALPDYALPSGQRAGGPRQTPE